MAVTTPKSATHASTTKAQLLDVAEQLFLRSGLGVSVRDITDAAGQNGAAIHYHFGSRDALVGAVIARRANDLAARRRAALQTLRDAPTAPTIHDVVSGLVGAYVGMVEAEGPDAQRWVDLMHALWLDRSPALAFMHEQAADERDWSNLARAALPHLTDDVFAARLELAIETIIVGLRTPTRAPGSDAVRLPAPLAARAAILVDFVAAALEGT
ncbi:MAG TPA: TetR family transcriptional regulator [Acidimicrobiia bacterium]